MGQDIPAVGRMGMVSRFADGAFVNTSHYRSKSCRLKMERDNDKKRTTINKQKEAIC